VKTVSGTNCSRGVWSGREGLKEPVGGTLERTKLCPTVNVKVQGLKGATCTSYVNRSSTCASRLSFERTWERSAH